MPLESAKQITVGVSLAREASAQDAQIALLDGLPLENHQWLRNRLIVDDPDGWAETYPANDRWHGTAMASLLTWGDAAASEDPSGRPIYVRPVMRPARRGLNGQSIERIPPDQLPLDLVHRAFRRMFEGEAEEPPTAPGVKIVNFSIGDEAIQFDREISPWARLFDWLSWHYNVLILVSVGNYLDHIELEVTNDELDTLSPEEVTTELARSVAKQIQQRRLLAPAEALNVLSVGALHEDASHLERIPQHLWDDSSMVGQPSPINRLGYGYGRSLKPDVLIPGGRQLYRRKLGPPSHRAVLEVVNKLDEPPGQLVAAPGSNPGQTDFGCYISGTSNATAIGSRRASEIIDVVRSLDTDPSGSKVPEEWLPVMAKALLVHGAAWGDSLAFFRRIITEGVDSQAVRPYTARFLGFGNIDVNSPLHCSEHIVTVLGYGAFDSEGVHSFQLPIPDVFQRDQVWKRITLTLAWIAPINSRNRAYRRAVLSLAPTMTSFKATLGVDGVDADASSTKRGTVQHVRLEGSATSRLANIDTLELEVMYRERAGGLNQNPVRYSVAATIEADQSIGVRLYEEIATRIRQSVPVQVFRTV